MSPPPLPGVYLDGGFGVGKTHLLAAAWHSFGQRHRGSRRFGSFLQYTSLVGALGYARAAAALQGTGLVCIDEFELDDPGDTMIMTRLVRELVESGSRVIATSNTPPGALGAGRFAADAFLREISSMSSHFRVLRIDGEDFRQRSTDGTAWVVSTALLEQIATEISDRKPESCSYDSFSSLQSHLRSVHPSLYPHLISGLELVCLQDVAHFELQSDALLFCAFIDAVYNAQIPIAQSGTPLNEVFPEDMLSGGFRKKYLRAASRVVALTGQAQEHLGGLGLLVGDTGFEPVTSSV